MLLVAVVVVDFLVNLFFNDLSTPHGSFTTRYYILISMGYISMRSIFSSTNSGRVLLQRNRNTNISSECKKKVQLRIVRCGTDSRVSISLNTTICTTLNQNSFFIFSLYLHNFPSGNIFIHITAPTSLRNSCDSRALFW